MKKTIQIAELPNVLSPKTPPAPRFPHLELEMETAVRCIQFSGEVETGTMAGRVRFSGRSSSEKMSVVIGDYRWLTVKRNPESPISVDAIEHGSENNYGNGHPYDAVTRDTMLEILGLVAEQIGKYDANFLRAHKNHI